MDIEENSWPGLREIGWQVWQGRAGNWRDLACMNIEI